MRGVDSVGLHPEGSKADQGNDSEGHYQAHSFLVFSSVYPSFGMEFELSRCQHSTDKRQTFTVTAFLRMWATVRNKWRPGAFFAPASLAVSSYQQLRELSKRTFVSW